MTKTVTKLAALGVALFTTAFTPFAKADEWDKRIIVLPMKRSRFKERFLSRASTS